MARVARDALTRIAAALRDARSRRGGVATRRARRERAAKVEDERAARDGDAGARARARGGVEKG